MYRLESYSHQPEDQVVSLREEANMLKSKLAISQEEVSQCRHEAEARGA